MSQTNLESLNFVEFLEFICRISLAVYTDPFVYIRNKVHDILEILFKQFEVEANIDEKLCFICDDEEDDKIIKMIKKFLEVDEADFLIGLQIVS